MAILEGFHCIELYMDFNLPILFCDTFYRPYSPNSFTAKVFYYKVCIVYCYSEVIIYKNELRIMNLKRE